MTEHEDKKMGKNRFTWGGRRMGGAFVITLKLYACSGIYLSVLIPKYSVILFFQAAGIALIWAAEGGFRKNKIDRGFFLPFCDYSSGGCRVLHKQRSIYQNCQLYFNVDLFDDLRKRSQRWENRFVKLMAAAGVFSTQRC